MRRLIECVANFSEGRDRSVIDSIAAQITGVPGVAILHRTSDADHHRTVLTFAGAPRDVAEAAIRAVGEAARLIDLNLHGGVHPRIGAADVVPFVPLEGTTLEECAAFAHEVGREVWDRFAVPVYFYEAAALTEARRRLENVRRGGFERLREAAVLDPARSPDVGGPGLHPTAGAVVIGARKILIAWNVNLASEDLAAAREIAAKVRASSGGLPCVKALGLRLHGRRQVQVSVNLTDYERTPLHTVFLAIKAEAEARGIRVAGTEIIGLVPRAALAAGAVEFFHFENFIPSVVLERRIEETIPPLLDEMLARLADPARTAGSRMGLVAAAGMAAAIGELVCRSAGEDPSAFAALRESFGYFGCARSAEFPVRVGELTSALRDLAKCRPETGDDLRIAISLAAVAAGSDPAHDATIAGSAGHDRSQD